MSLHLLTKLLAEGTPVFQPFLILGDPEPELSLELLTAVIEGGARSLELGLPYNSAAADGPEIAGASRRALTAGVDVRRALDVLGRFRARYEVPVNLLVYGNLVLSPGAEGFCRRAADAGASTLLSPDVPFEESAVLGEACEAAGLGHVQLVGPRTSAPRLARLAAAADGFLYLVSHRGVTGARRTLPEESLALIRRVSSRSPLPVCAGFGLSHPEHLQDVFEAGARLAVVGSALAARIRRGLEGGDPTGELVDSIRAACSEFVAMERARC